MQEAKEAVVEVVEAVDEVMGRGEASQLALARDDDV